MVDDELAEDAYELSYLCGLYAFDIKCGHDRRWRGWWKEPGREPVGWAREMQRVAKLTAAVSSRVLAGSTDSPATRHAKSALEVADEVLRETPSYPNGIVEALTAIEGAMLEVARMVVSRA